jgi:hypothetical protein
MLDILLGGDMSACGIIGFRALTINGDDNANFFHLHKRPGA